MIDYALGVGPAKPTSDSVGKKESMDASSDAPGGGKTALVVAPAKLDA